MVSIKICGIREPAIIDAAIALGGDYAGLVFFPRSPRNVSMPHAASLAAHARGRIRTVAVTVDADDALLSAIASQVQPDFLQLHGNETPQRMSEIRQTFALPVIKAIALQSAKDMQCVKDYAAADMLLFDAKPPLPAHSPQAGEGTFLPGGNALAFDWTLLQNRAIPLPWMLSGGLNAGNVRDAITTSGAMAVDISSGVESAPGVKDVQKMQEFIKAVKDER